MTEETKTTLGVGDLAGVVRIIDVCSKRGAFEGSEMVAVGSLREKIAAFVEENTPKPDEEDPVSDAAAEETVDG
jgi:hypothetical protein